jgi:chromate reductase
MKTLLAISGSASKESSNTELLGAIERAFANRYHIDVYDGLWELPLFTPEQESDGVPVAVRKLRDAVRTADAVIISTPEYLHNIPAVLKNALEWMTTSGELANKSVLPITFCPAPPRGEYAMLSLLQSLKASKAAIVAELPMYRTDLSLQDGIIQLNETQLELLNEALGLL